MFRSAAILLAMSAATLAGRADAAGETPSIQERFQLEEAKTPVRERDGWRKPERILVLGVPKSAVAQWQAAAPGVELVFAGSGAEALSGARDVDAVIGSCSSDLLEAGKRIRWVQVYAAGVEDCVAVPAFRERDILLTNAQRVLGPVIAEHVTAMMLALTRGFDAFIPAQTERQWRRDAASRSLTQVEGKTMLVVGLGGIGTEIAERAHALRMRVIATRASGRTGPDFVSYVGLPDELHKLAREADVIVNATPLTPQTTDLFDAEFFAQMKPSAYFINIGRGRSVVTSALVDALYKGKIGGAALDVVEPEPLPSDHPLWTAPNIIITPHVSNASDLGFAARLEVALENLRRYVAGERMLSVVDVAKGY